jgi:SAM-dependent methyltransferase
LPHAAEAVDPESRLAASIIQITRELSRTTPAPKAAPFFGLDNDQPYDLTILEDLSSPGIFRKYELVLLLHCGLGGAARWLSRRLGCRLLGVDSDARRVRAAQRLSRRAGVAEQVSFVAANPEQLALRERTFTHVWIVDPPEAYRSARALGEAFRVLRSGAHCGVQTELREDVQIEQVANALLAAGFVDVRVRHSRLMPPGQLASTARARMRQSVEGQPEVTRVWRDESIDAGAPCVQLFCRRE